MAATSARRSGSARARAAFSAKPGLRKTRSGTCLAADPCDCCRTAPTCRGRSGGSRTARRTRAGAACGVHGNRRGQAYSGARIPAAQTAWRCRAKTGAAARRHSTGQRPAIPAGRATTGSRHAAAECLVRWLDRFWREQRSGFNCGWQPKTATGALAARWRNPDGATGGIFAAYRPVPRCCTAICGAATMDFWRWDRVISTLRSISAIVNATLAMSELFGGFAPDFYAPYREAWPLDAGYAVRQNALQPLPRPQPRQPVWRWLRSAGAAHVDAVAGADPLGRSITPTWLAVTRKNPRAAQSDPSRPAAISPGRLHDSACQRPQSRNRQANHPRGPARAPAVRRRASGAAMRGVAIEGFSMPAIQRVAVVRDAGQRSWTSITSFATWRAKPGAAPQLRNVPPVFRPAMLCEDVEVLAHQLKQQRVAR